LINFSNNVDVVVSQLVDVLNVVYCGWIGKIMKMTIQKNGVVPIEKRVLNAFLF